MFGAIDVSVGTAGAVTVSVTALDTPLSVVTVTFRAVRAAPFVMVQLTWKDVAVGRVIVFTGQVTPLPPTVIAVGLARFVPVSV